MRRFSPQSLGRCLAVLGLIVGFSGCALRDRAEDVYLQQHRASTALTDAIVAAEADDSDLAERLYLLEAVLAKTCARLRESAIRRINDQTTDAELEWGVYRSLDACSAKTREVANLLRDIDPESAAYFLDGPNLAVVPPGE